jgi:hypothetical protein
MAARPQAGEPTLKRFGITLSNRGILLGLTTVPKLLALADTVEACPPMDCVWAGDALFVNPAWMPPPGWQHSLPHLV